VALGMSAIEPIDHIFDLHHHVHASRGMSKA
jgi:hypothetical protein